MGSERVSTLYVLNLLKEETGRYGSDEPKVNVERLTDIAFSCKLEDLWAEQTRHPEGICPDDHLHGGVGFALIRVLK